MLFPVRCFTCGKVIGNMWKSYEKLIDDKKTPDEALDKLGYRRFCCRRMFLSYPKELDDELNMYDLSSKSGNVKSK